jgi:hypothetical protein
MRYLNLVRKMNAEWGGYSGMSLLLQPNVAVESLPLLIRIRKTLGSNFCSETDYRDLRFCMGFLSSLQIYLDGASN